jgi:hypothetical protein
MRTLHGPVAKHQKNLAILKQTVLEILMRFSIISVLFFEDSAWQMLFAKPPQCLYPDITATCETSVKPKQEPLCS